MLPDLGGSAACLASGPSNEGPFLWPQLGGSWKSTRSAQAGAVMPTSVLGRL